MKHLAASLFLLFLSAAAQATPIDDWNTFEKGVRDGTLPKQEAALRLAPLIADVSSYITAQYRLSAGGWGFPLAGYDRRAMDKHDFQPGIRYGTTRIKGYDFFDGNRHGGHPAYDIFIRDRNRDCRDDRTGRAVEAVAMDDMVVLSISEGWKKGSGLRGGNYVWLYNPLENRFFYYAHLDSVSVAPGELLQKGGTVGTVGRTGVLAARKRSPTHLHLMVLEYTGGKLIPVDYYSLIN